MKNEKQATSKDWTDAAKKHGFGIVSIKPKKKFKMKNETADFLNSVPGKMVISGPVEVADVLDKKSNKRVGKEYKETFGKKEGKKGLKDYINRSGHLTKQMRDVKKENKKTSQKWRIRDVDSNTKRMFADEHDNQFKQWSKSAKQTRPERFKERMSMEKSLKKRMPAAYKGIGKKAMKKSAKEDSSGNRVAHMQTYNIKNSQKKQKSQTKTFVKGLEKY